MVQRARIALVLAAVMAISAVGSAAAANITESLSVTSSLACTGIPAAINYGAIDSGTTSGDQSFTVNCTANSGYDFALSGSDFTGPAALSKAQREVKFDALSGVTTPTVSYISFSDPLLNGTTSVIHAAAAGSTNFTPSLHVVIPAAQYAGAYTGTVTYTFTAN